MERIVGSLLSTTGDTEVGCILPLAPDPCIQTALIVFPALWGSMINDYAFNSLQNAFSYIADAYRVDFSPFSIVNWFEQYKSLGIFPFDMCPIPVLKLASCVEPFLRTLPVKIRRDYHTLKNTLFIQNGTSNDFYSAIRVPLEDQGGITGQLG